MKLLNQRLQDEMNFHKKEIKVLKLSKDTLKSVLRMKTQDVKLTSSNELMRIHDIKKKAENSRLQQQLQGEKIGSEQKLFILQRRIAEFGLQVGQEQI